MKKELHVMRAAPLNIQKRWTPKGFNVDDEYGCLTIAERLAKAKPRLKFTVGRTRFIGEKKWGDHAWCVNPKGNIIDPYFILRGEKLLQKQNVLFLLGL